MSQTAKLSPRVLVAFGFVYVFWGSTFVAIRFGVEVLPPLVLAGVRFVVAGLLMLAICAARGMKLRQSWRDLGMLAIIGVLILGIGNVGVVWAEQYIPSGLASLLVAVIPLYVALLEAVLPGGEGLQAKGWVGVGIGFAGLVILVSPGLREGWHGQSEQLLASAVTLIAAFAWSGGSVLSRRARVSTSAFVAAAWQMLFAGAFNFGMMLVLPGDNRVHFGRQAVLSIAWLVVFGSLAGYSAYIYLLENVPVAKVSTYAYVNPIIAVILGAQLLGERMVPIEYAGMAAILIAVYLVTSSKLRVVEVTEAEEVEAIG